MINCEVKKGQKYSFGEHSKPEYEVTDVRFPDSSVETTPECIWITLYHPDVCDWHVSLSGIRKHFTLVKP